MTSWPPTWIVIESTKLTDVAGHREDYRKIFKATATFLAEFAD